VKRRTKSDSLSTFVDELQANGRYSFTLDEIRALPGRSAKSAQAILGRLKQQGRIASPRRGFFVIIPVEYRKSGCPPASWFIDNLMRFMQQPYYVGLLSAAALHSAAHQQPMAFQVITDRPTRSARAAGVRIEFHINRAVGSVPVVDMQTETGSMRVSTPAATAFDLVRYASTAGHLSNVATVLNELVEKLDANAIVDVAALYSVPDAQRLGYLLEMIGRRHLNGPLWDWLSERRYRVVPLVSGPPTNDEKVDPRWKVLPNADVEADL
jgi:predicted transcriptional regulator of viral defense system